MVIKKDPRALLELLSRPVDTTDDEFLDKIDKDKSFHSMPDKPAGELKINGVMNNEQEKMLASVVDVEVDEDDLKPVPQPRAPSLPVDLTSNERRFFSLFQGTSSKEEAQTSVPEELKLKLVGSASEAPELPRVGETEAEKEAKEEDMARRAAYLAAQAEAQASVVPNPAQQEAHDRYVRIFGDVRQKA